MALNIKDEETDRLARELAAETGLSLTEAIREAVEAQLKALRRKKRLGSGSELSEVIARGRSRSMINTSTEAEILGYDQDGLPA